MEQVQFLNNFLEDRQKEILAIAQQNNKEKFKEIQLETEEIVKRETALMDFELLFSATLLKEEEKLTLESRELREECWEELNKESNGDYNKLNEILNNL